MAVFKLTETDDSFQLELIFDREDFAQSTGHAEKKLSKSQLQTYIEKHTQWQVDNHRIMFSVTHLEIDDDHYKASCIAPKEFKKYNRLSVDNTFLLDIDNQSNIIMIDLNNKSRDFRMHSNRRALIVELSK